MTKIQKLFAMYERFARAIESIPDEKVRRLHGVASGVSEFVAKARLRQPQPTSSQVAAGLEQALREMPDIIQGLDAEWRLPVTKALNEALLSEYPEFWELESERLAKILTRGKIRTDAEFYRVRHRIDVLEGEQESETELRRLYALVDAYEARA